MKKIYAHVVKPENYPEFNTRIARAVTADDLNNEIQFTTLRGFPMTDANIADIGEASDMGNRPLPDSDAKLKDLDTELDVYTKHFRLGNVLWPVYSTMFASNFNELVDKCVERGLYLYDFFGYVPGSKPHHEIWGEYSIPEAVDSYMSQNLKNHFLGYDNGEQDGRYCNALATKTSPLSSSRVEQYKNLQHYFEKLNDAMQNHTVTLAALPWLHYFAKEGNTIMIGAETAQGLPSNPMWFSFIRGASNQYGLLTFGNASMWNRWGYKDYNFPSYEPDMSCGYESGRTGGASLGLLRRLIYNQYMYNCKILGFETSWLVTSRAKPGDKTDENNYVTPYGKKYTLTPVGQIQRYCNDFTKLHPTPGAFYAPVAIIRNFFCGWNPPRILYNHNMYQVWGNLPYNTADYQTDCIFEMLYPGYANSGWFRDERGFMSPTPYGECADVLFDDARSEIINRYNVVVLTSDVNTDKEICDKLNIFTTRGGEIYLFEDLVVSNQNNKYFNALISSGNVHIIPGNGLQKTDDILNSINEDNKEICRPYTLSSAAEDILAKAFLDQTIIKVNNPMLQYSLCIQNENTFTLFVSNNTLQDEYYDIISDYDITDVTQWEINANVKNSEEFYPRKEFVTIKGATGEGKCFLPAFDCAIFEIHTKEKIQLSPESNPSYLPHNIGLSLPLGKSIKEFLLENPTFKYHFDRLSVQAEYFDKLSTDAAIEEAHYVTLQKIAVTVDFSRMLNHVPDLTIVGNFPQRTAKSIQRIEEILNKAKKYNCDSAIFRFHRRPENGYNDRMSLKGTEESLKKIYNICKSLSIEPILTNCIAFNDINSQYKIAKKIGFKIAFNTAEAYRTEEYGSKPKEFDMLLLSDNYTDTFGQEYGVHTPLYLGQHFKQLKDDYLMARDNNIPIILTAEYENNSQISEDLELLALN